MQPKNTVDIDILRALLDAEDDGTLRWRQGQRMGKVAGSTTGSGYIAVAIRGRLIPAHRIVWALNHGRWPAGVLDHIDGCRKNNRPSNLREASPSGNCQNVAKSPGKSSQYLGVSWNKRAGSWEAYIRINRKLHSLGKFADEEMAHKAYLFSKRQMHTFEPYARRGVAAAKTNPEAIAGPGDVRVAPRLPTAQR